LKHRKYILVQK